MVIKGRGAGIVKARVASMGKGMGGGTAIITKLRRAGMMKARIVRMVMARGAEMV